MITEVKPGSFIYEVKDALTKDNCKLIIDRFESDKESQTLGVAGSKRQVNRSLKRSVDLVVTNNSKWQDVDNILFESLGTGIGLMSGLHSFFDAYHLIDMGYQIQRTDTGDFYKWHADSGPGFMSQRQLVAIWYLNTVEHGGATQFLHQGIDVKPEEGKLILFPPFWTHVHQGQIVEAGVKYIATTWINIDDNKGAK